VCPVQRLIFGAGELAIPSPTGGWRRRGIGPSYMKKPGGYVRSRSHISVIALPSGPKWTIGAGELHWCDGRPHGTILYAKDKLSEFVSATVTPAGGLPRPFPGRRPGDKLQTATNVDESAGMNEGAPVPRPPPFDAGPLLNSETAAYFLRVTSETLRGWRRRGIGLAHVALPGGLVRYVVTDLINFAVDLELQRTRLRSRCHAYASLPRIAAGK
jgi:hypothetical protein